MAGNRAATATPIWALADCQLEVFGQWLVGALPEQGRQLVALQRELLFKEQ